MELCKSYEDTINTFETETVKMHTTQHTNTEIDPCAYISGFFNRVLYILLMFKKEEKEKRAREESEEK